MVFGRANVIYVCTLLAGSNWNINGELNMINFLSFFLDNLIGFLNRGKCNMALIRVMYDKLVQLPFEVHNDTNLSELELFKLGKGDCEDKAPVLARYMIHNGCTGVKLLYMTSIDEEEAGHVAVLHYGYVYDPTMDYWHYPDWNYKSIMKSYKDFRESKVFW